MQFDLDRNIDGAALDVQSNISATLRKLPPQLPAPPSFQKLNPADSPILFIALVSKTLPLSKVDDYAEQVFAEQISQITGVAQVLVFGQQKFAVRVVGRSRRSRGARPDARQCQQRGRRRQFLDAGRRAARPPAERHGRCDRPDGRTRPNTTISSSPGATARRSGSRRSRTVYDSVENKQIAGLERRRSRDRAGGVPPVRRQHRRRRRQREGEDSLLPVAAAAFGRRRSFSTTARSRSASRSRTCSSRCCSRSCWSSSSSSCS